MSSTPRTRGPGFVGFDPMGDPARRAKPRAPIPALVAQLVARVAQGEDPGAVLTALSVHNAYVRSAYLAAAGLDGDPS